jgi:hypothetical protein
MSIDLKSKSEMKNTDDTDRNDDYYLDDSRIPDLIDKKTNHKPSHIHGNELSRKLTYVSIRSYPMISIMIGGKERVRLAQISNTLLKMFSYNHEIHNRRVALGINFTQCTPTQLQC